MFADAQRVCVDRNFRNRRRTFYGLSGRVDSWAGGRSAQVTRSRPRTEPEGRIAAVVETHPEPET
jgi:hypothetical protein